MKRYWDWFEKKIVDQKEPYADPKRYTAIVYGEGRICVEFYRARQDRNKAVSVSYRIADANLLPHDEMITILLEDAGVSREEVDSNPYLLVAPKEGLEKIIKTYGFVDIEEDNK